MKCRQSLMQLLESDLKTVDHYGSVELVLLKDLFKGELPLNPCGHTVNVSIYTCGGVHVLEVSVGFANIYWILFASLTPA